MAEIEDELKSLLMKVKEESEIAGLKLNIKKLRSWHPVSSLRGKEMGKQWKQWQTLFSWALKSLFMVTAAMKLEDTCSLKEKPVVLGHLLILVGWMLLFQSDFSSLSSDT